MQASSVRWAHGHVNVFIMLFVPSARLRHELIKIRAKHWASHVHCLKLERRWMNWIS